MAYPTVRPNDPLDQPSHSGLHNQHATDLEALQAFRELFAGGDAGEVLAKTTNDDYDIEWLPGGTGGGGDGGDYPGISSEDPNGLGLGTDGGLRVEPADLLSDNEGQQLKVAADDGKLHMAYDIVDALPEDDDTTYSIGDVVFVTGPGDGGSAPGVGGGKVLQVVRATDDEKLNRTLTTNDFQDVPKMSVTIAPKSDSSAIIIIAAAAIRVWATGDDFNLASVRIVDQNDNPVSGAETVDVGLHRISGAGNRESRHDLSLFAYDSPATTSPVTYRMQAKITVGTDSVSFRNDQATGQLFAIEVAK